MRILRLPLAAALIAASVLATADTYSLRLTPFPNAEVADGRSQITISAQVFQDGRAVPDGTQVVFSTNLGSFKESVVRTTSGWARAILVTGGVPGTAKISATVLGGDSSPSTCEVELVKSRADLTVARETIELTSSGSLAYAHDQKIIEGVAADGGVIVRYRDIEVRADVLQLDLTEFSLKARKATLRRGRSVKKFDQLSLDLTSRTGLGLTTYPVARPTGISTYPGGIAFTEDGPDNTTAVAVPRMRMGMVAVTREGDTPVTDPVDDDPFEMADLTGSPSTVSAKQAVVYARREIQFHKAEIYVDNAKILRLPLFVVNLYSNNGSPLVTEDLLSVNDNQIALNYPHYLSLRPGLSSLLRFRTGERYGQSLTASRGAFLDYELNWSKGDDMQGGFTFGGVGRSDWVASLRQFWRMNERTTATLQAESPSASSVFGSASIGHSFSGYNLSLNAAQNQTIRGAASSYKNYSFGLDRDAQRISRSPFRFTYGLTASQSESSYRVPDSKTKEITTVSDAQAGAGFTARMFSDSIPLDAESSINSSLTATRLFGETAYQGIALSGVLSYTRRLGAGASMFATYNYLQGGLNQSLIGRHNISLIGNYSVGATSLRMTFNKALDVERMSIFADASYRLSGLWRLGYSHFFDQTSNFQDYYFILGYRIGWREVGLTWTKRTHRLGFQLMNVNF